MFFQISGIIVIKLGIVIKATWLTLLKHSKSACDNDILIILVIYRISSLDLFVWDLMAL